MDLQISRGYKAAALQVIRYVQLPLLSQRTPTITVKMINITARKKYHSRRRALSTKFLSPTQQQSSLPTRSSPSSPPNTAAVIQLYSAQQQSQGVHYAILPSSTQQRSHHPLLTLSATRNCLNQQRCKFPLPVLPRNPPPSLSLPRTHVALPASSPSLYHLAFYKIHFNVVMFIMTYVVKEFL